MDKTPNSNGGTDKMTPSEVLAAQKAWRMQKRRELEARNKKKAARQQIVDTTNYGVTSATTQNVAQSNIGHPPLKRYKPTTYHAAETTQLQAPVENNPAVMYAVNSYPASQPGTYQHYEYVGANTTTTLLPNNNAPPGAPVQATVQSVPNDEHTRTIEAQRVWKEQKLREIAEKRSKGTPSKRGRRKGSTVDVASAGVQVTDETNQHHVPIVGQMGVSMGMGATSTMPLNPQHSMPLASHSMPLNSHGMVQNSVGQQQNQEADETAADLVAMANQGIGHTISGNPLDQYTFIGGTEHKEEAHAVEQPQNVSEHQQQMQNAAVEQHHQQQMQNVAVEQQHHPHHMTSVVVEQHQPSVVSNVAEHQAVPNVEAHHQTEVVSNVAEHHSHGQQIENVVQHTAHQIENVGEHHGQEQIQEVEGQQQVGSVQQHHQHEAPAVTVPMHPEANQTAVEVQVQQTNEGVAVADEQGPTVQGHQVGGGAAETVEHEGQTVIVTHHQAQGSEEVKNVQENKGESGLDANGVAAENGGSAAYADTATAGDAFQIDGSEDMLGAAAAWHDGLGNINHN